MGTTKPAPPETTASRARSLPDTAVCPYAAVVLGYPALRLKSLIIVDRDGRRVLSTKPVIDVLGEAAA